MSVNEAIKMREAVKVESLTYKFPGSAHNALENVSLIIYEGEFFLLTGPSGSGKTTLALCILGIIPRKLGGSIKGQVRVYGRLSTDKEASSASEKVAMVFQNPDEQFISLRIREELLAGVDWRRTTREEAEKRMEDSLNTVGLSGFSLRSTSELSDGQKQRVAIASTLMKDANILILDEPLSVLDLPAGKSFVETMEILKRQGRTIICIAHNVGPVVHLADRIGVLTEGRLSAVGSPKQLLYSEEFSRVEKAPMVVEFAKRLDSAKRPLTCEEFVRDIGKVKLEDVPNPVNLSKEIIVFEDVTFAYPNGTIAIRDLSLAIRQGEYLAIVGPNGSGKSTLGFLMNGILKPTNGVVTVCGVPTTKQSQRVLVLKVGVVPQNPGEALFEATVHAEAAYGPNILRLEEPEAKADTALLAMGIAELRERDPLRLSFGEKKKALLAAIFSLESEILVVDEPDLGIDLRAADDLFKLLSELNSQGKTVVLLTHNLDYVYRYVPRVVILFGGQMTADENPRKVLKDNAIMKAASLLVPDIASITES